MGRHRLEASSTRARYEGAGKRRKQKEGSRAADRPGRLARPGIAGDDAIGQVAGKVDKASGRGRGQHASPIRRSSVGGALADAVPYALGAVVIAGSIAGAIVSDHARVAPVAAESVPPSEGQGRVGPSVDRPGLVSRSASGPGRGLTSRRVGQMVESRNDALARLRQGAVQEARNIALDTWVLPMTSYQLTGTFGETSSLWSTVHTGLDFAGPEGTPIRSVAGGVVTDAGWAGAYGYRTIVTLPDGTEIWYCHQSSIGVDVGQPVDTGQEIGTVGSTGNVTGPHLHLEVRPGGGDPVDPWVALKAHRALAQ